MFDVLIIGAGVVGCAIARELARYQMQTAVVEQCSDVAMGTSKANSAIVHAGYDAKPSTCKAEMNLAGNGMLDALSSELDFPFRRNGSLTLCFDEASMPQLQALLERGRQNGVEGLSILDRAQLLEIEPNVGSKAIAALYAPTGGIVCPYEMTVALAENAAANGVKFFLGHKVLSLAKDGNSFCVETSKNTFSAKLVVNAAGVFADEINNMLSAYKLHIIPRAGQYCLLDKTVGSLVTHTLFQLPGKLGKGVLIAPTVHGNLILGPTAVDIDDKNDVSTTRQQYEEILRVAGLTLEQIPTREVITAFTGLRAHSVDDDFIIEEAPDIVGLINVAGIESPGLTSAPAIAKRVEQLVTERLAPAAYDGFNPVRHGIVKFSEMDIAQRSAMIAQNPLYGKVVCRCETITEAEIVDAIHRPLGAMDLDGVKRRTRAGMGRCQSGFCSPQVAAILARELNIPLTSVTKFGGGSRVLVGKNKEQ